MKRTESGFALLFVFAMASILAISLYIALPRVTFEAQRDKEQLLISRGEQYKRGIQLYVRKFKRFPAKMEDLDNANGIRFLRHHYKDPMTGKDEWRLIHAGPGGVLLDSLIKPLNDKDKKLATQSSITELLGVGGLPETDPTANPGLRKRPSDQQGAPGSATAPGSAPGAPIPPDPPQGTLPGSQPPSPLGAQPPTSTPPTSTPPTNPAQPPAAAQGSSSISAGFSVGAGPATAPVTGPVPNQINQQLQNPSGAPNGATPNAQGSAEATKLIGQLLTTPRPGGLAGIPNANTNNTIGGGIAGVASPIKTGSGIKIYNEQDEYKKWEFVYDPTKETGAGGAVPQQAAAPGTPIGSQPGATPGSQAGSQPGSQPFGSAPGTPVQPATPPK